MVSFLGPAAAALLTGFAMMALQTTAIRVAGLSFGSSQFTFSMVVATFVFSIAVGSFAVSLLPRIPARALPVSQWLLVAPISLAPIRHDAFAPSPDLQQPLSATAAFVFSPPFVA